MRQIAPIFKREFFGYFRSPVAYVFLIAFLIISVSLAFSRYGGFFRAGGDEGDRQGEDGEATRVHDR